MSKLAEIRQKLEGGARPADLIKQGYAKSSVYAMAKTVSGSQSTMPAADDDELAALRKRKEIVKLEKEIADIEAAKGTPLEKRVTGLELEVQFLRLLIGEVGDDLLSTIAFATGQGTKAECEKRCAGFVDEVEEELQERLENS